MAAELTVANRGDNEGAPLVFQELPGEVRDVLGDTHYNAPDLRRQCHRHGCELVATQRGPYPHRDGGVEVPKCAINGARKPSCPSTACSKTSLIGG